MVCLNFKLKQQRCFLMNHKESAEGVVPIGPISPVGKA